MITISLCMIVRNEEAFLARCLDSVAAAADEIIIVDTGSTDNTKNIAHKYTGKVYDFEWTDDFSAARNTAWSKAAMDYQMWMDADEMLPADSLKKLLSLKEELPPDADLVMMKQCEHFDEEGTPVFTFMRERLARRKKGYLWEGAVHECIAPSGNIFLSDIEIHHKKAARGEPSRRNLDIYTALERSGAPFAPRHLYYFARELKDHGFWAKASYYFEKFLDSEEGWVEDKIMTCYSLSFCYAALGERHKILPVLVKSFLFGSPRAEICSEIGYYHKHAGDYHAALNWFKLAANLERPDDVLGFVLPDYWGYIPNLECCLCCYELGDSEGAKKYNELAAVCKPHAEAVKINRKFFAMQKQEMCQFLPAFGGNRN